MKIGDYVAVDVNFKAAKYGVQSLKMHGTITKITNNEIILDSSRIVYREYANIVVLPNVIPFSKRS